MCREYCPDVQAYRQGGHFKIVVTLLDGQPNFQTIFRIWQHHEKFRSFIVKNWANLPNVNARRKLLLIKKTIVICLESHAQSSMK